MYQFARDVIINYHKLGGLNKNLFSHGLETRSLKPRYHVRRATLPLRTLGKNSFSPLLASSTPCLPVVLGIPCFVAPQLQSLPLSLFSCPPSVCVCISKSLFLKKTPVIGFSLIQYELM